MVPGPLVPGGGIVPGLMAPRQPAPPAKTGVTEGVKAGNSATVPGAVVVMPLPSLGFLSVDCGMMGRGFTGRVCTKEKHPWSSLPPEVLI